MPTKALAIRRILTVLSLALLLCAAPARAALPLHAGQAILPDRLDVRPLRGLNAYSHTLVELKGPNDPAEIALRAAGARLISPQLGLWRVRTGPALRVLPDLLAAHDVRSVSPDLPLQTMAAPSVTNVFTDPLSISEWWPSHVGADRWTPPGPGFPITLIDVGIDLSHEEFAKRPDTAALNTQTLTSGIEDEHGTATASVAAAPENGLGLVGIYPRAKLQEWDASPGTFLTVGDEIAGLSSAIQHGPGVINLSLGGFDRIPIEEHAILGAFAAGSLVVASAGNDRSQGSPPSYPSAFAHVLSIGATDELDRVTSFSSSARTMDLAAPGQNMTVAVPTSWNPVGYSVMDGTSFSAPLVAGAAAGVWTLRPKLTNTQLFEVMRRSARDVGKRGWDKDTGYGILNVAAALARKAPPVDPQEPNEDIYLVKPKGLLGAGHEPITAPHHGNRVLHAHVERAEDPEDVYRAYLPSKGRLVVTVRTNANVDLEVWGRHTRTVFERGAAARRDLLGMAAHRGSRFERVTIHGRGVAQYVYVDVFLPKAQRQADYSVSVATARR
jgi:Subtilase family